MPVNKFGDSGDDTVIFTTNTSSTIGITLSQINNIFLRRDGANNATGDLNMGGHRIVNISSPSAAGDATSKSYVDSTTVSKTGDTMTGNLIMQIGDKPSLTLGCNDLRGGPGRVPKRFNLLLGNTSDLIQNQLGQPLTLQASNGIVLRVADSELAKFNSSNIAFHNDINMNERFINNLRTPENDGDAASKKYVDSLIGSSAPHITSTPTMTSNNTTINRLTYVSVASSMSVGQTRAWRAFTNEVVTPNSASSGSGWVSSAKDATPWIQMQYPSGIVITSFNIFVRNVVGRNITSWNVQGGNNPGGSEFTTLLAGSAANMQLNANNYYSFNIDNSTAYKVYRFNILSRSGGSDIGISLLQFNTSIITANGYTPMAANLNMNRHRVTNVLDPSFGSDAATKGFLERFIKSVDNLPVAELASLINSKIGDKFLDMKGSKIRNLGAPTASSDAATRLYVDNSIAAAVSGIAPSEPAASEDILSKSTADRTYLKLDGGSVMTGGLDMGRFGIRQLREPTVGSDAATKGFVERVSALNVKYEGATADINMQQHRIANLLDPREPQDCATKKYVDDIFADRLIGSFDLFMNVLSETHSPKEITIPLNSKVGNTIKLIFTISSTIRPPSASEDITAINRSTHFVTPFAVTDNISATEFFHSTILDLTIFSPDGHTKICHAFIKPFNTDSSSLNVTFATGTGNYIRRIKVDIYKN